MTIEMQGLDGSPVTITREDLQALRTAHRGPVLEPADAGYEPARKVWNAMIDRRPALIARCTGSVDVQQAVRFAARHRLLNSVRGGGHNIAGLAICEGGLVIDLSQLRGVWIDAEARTVRAQAGCTLADVDRETQAHGLAAVMGFVSTTGIAGLTVGGGFGYLTRQHGWTCDTLVSMDVVTAEGKLVRASATENAELFWALRGGGGNFGVVTSFRFRLHPVGPQVHAGLVVYPFAQAGAVLRAWRDFCACAPDELSVWAVMRKAPPLPFLPAAVHGQEVVIFALVWSGAVEEGERAVAPVLAFGEPIAAALGAQPYAAFQTAFDPLLTPGGRNYWKSANFATLGDAAIDGLVAAASQLPGPECEIFVAQLGGAMSRVEAAATPFVGRDVRFIMNVHGRWADRRDDDAVRRWARRSFEAATPHATGSGYVNFLTEDEAERVSTSYGSNHARLQALKARFDPGNLFRMNLNITPRAAGR